MSDYTTPRGNDPLPKSLQRCHAKHPMWGAAVKCEELRGHIDEQLPHFNSFYMKRWDEPERTEPVHNGPCSERRRWSVQQGYDADWQCEHQAQCRCVCHKEINR